MCGKKTPRLCLVEWTTIPSGLRELDCGQWVVYSHLFVKQQEQSYQQTSL